MKTQNMGENVKHTKAIKKRFQNSLALFACFLPVPSLTTWRHFGSNGEYKTSCAYASYCSGSSKTLSWHPNEPMNYQSSDESYI